MTITLPEGLTAETQRLSGWGRTNPVTSQVVKPSTIEQLQELISRAPPKSLIARGLGRSYGDAAQVKDGTVIELPAFDHIEVNPSGCKITAGAGVSLDQILNLVVPAGFFLPVTPGTRNVTVGGAIAADVHGKNHHVDGSFGNHVQRILLVDGNGELRELTPTGRGSFDEAKLFWATVGGMGLTGVIVEATFSLIPITSSLITVDTTRFKDLKSLMASMMEANSRYQYSVAWIDSLDPKGRGVLTCGNHAPAEALPKDKQTNPLYYYPKALGKTPSFLSGRLLNKITMRAFNEAWYRKTPKHRAGELQELASFFHPLDGLQGWNRIYGPAGFLQYQFVVPDKAAHLILRTLEALRKVGAPSFLTVLKRFGLSNPAPLSFPMPGWSLAADVPAAAPGLLKVLDQLDKEVAAAGGRLYLAKDSRQSPEMFKQSYKRFDEWTSCLAKLNPREKHFSCIYKRCMQPN